MVLRKIAGDDDYLQDSEIVGDKGNEVGVIVCKCVHVCMCVYKHVCVWEGVCWCL